MRNMKERYVRHQLVGHIALMFMLYVEKGFDVSKLCSSIVGNEVKQQMWIGEKGENNILQFRCLYWKHVYVFICIERDGEVDIIS